MITTLLELEGYQVFSASSGAEAMRFLERERQKTPEFETPVDLILLDIVLGDSDGRDICRKIKEDEELKFIPVIILTVRSSLQDKINGLNIGADDYLTKPFINEELLAKVRVMLRIKDLHDELRREKNKNILLTQALEKRYSFGNIVGKNTRMQEIYELISDISNTDSTVLIQGESGTGKELIARAIHFNSHRKNKPFIVANCSAYSQNLLESELFGHEKGAFTGAIRRKIGRFEMAHGGTIFLDEIGEISPPTQILLLRVLQDHRFERVGGEETLESRRQGDCGDQQEPDGGDEERDLSRGPLLPAQCDPHLRSTPSGEKRRYSPSGIPLSQKIQPGKEERNHRVFS